MANVDRDLVIQAMAHAGLLDDVRDALVPVPVDRAILVTGLLVSIEAAIMLVLQNAEEIDRLVELGLDLPRIIKEDIAAFDFGFEGTDQVLDELGDWRLVYDEMLVNLEALGLRILEAVKEIDQVAALAEHLPSAEEAVKRIKEEFKP